MYGTTLTRALRATHWMLKAPGDGLLWWRDRLTRATAFDSHLPWLSWSSIRLLKRYLRPDSRVFEYGSGGSTLFFLDQPGCTVTCVENSPEWADRVQTSAARCGGGNRLTMRVVTMPERPVSGYEKEREAYVSSIEVGGPWDVVLVDGADGEPSLRVECTRRAREYLRPGGLLVLDDSWRREYDAIPTILKEFKRTECWGLGPARKGVTKTDIYEAAERRG